MLTFIFFSVIVITVYGIMTNPMADEERDEMLNDEEMWP